MTNDPKLKQELVTETPLSWFLRQSPEFKEAVYTASITKADEEQRKVVEAHRTEKTNDPLAMQTEMNKRGKQSEPEAPLTEKPLLDRLRGIPALTLDCPTDIAQAIDDAALDAIAEIERLTRERDEALKGCSDWGAKEYTARLQVERLRAALEQARITRQQHETDLHDLRYADKERIRAQVALRLIRNLPETSPAVRAMADGALAADSAE